MPTYDYHCVQCKYRMEAVQKITEEPHKICPKCGHETLRRGPGGGIGLAFKGNGFYKTDYTPSIDTHVNDSKAPCCPCGKTSPCSN